MVKTGWRKENNAKVDRTKCNKDEAEDQKRMANKDGEDGETGRRERCSRYASRKRRTVAPMMGMLFFFFFFNVRFSFSYSFFYAFFRVSVFCFLLSVFRFFYLFSFLAEGFTGTPPGRRQGMHGGEKSVGISETSAEGGERVGVCRAKDRGWRSKKRVEKEAARKDPTRRSAGDLEGGEVQGERDRSAAAMGVVAQSCGFARRKR